MPEKCFCPESVGEAASILGEYKEDVQVLAGGTDLFVMMRKEKSLSKYIMDISGAGLDYIRRENGTIRIGASVTLTEAQYHPLLSGNTFRCLREACGHVGSLQIRNAATLVGNICTGIPSADVASPLLALEARVHAVSERGERFIPIDEFFVKPRKLALQPDEFVTEVVLEEPADDENAGSRFRKIGPRKELVISIFNIAVFAQFEQKTARKVRIGMGVVSPVPVRLKKTEKLLEGTELGSETIEEAIRIMQTEISPRDSLHGSEAYRRLLAENLLRQYLTELADERKGGQQECL